jgi:uncharacterized protein YggE
MQIRNKLYIFKKSSKSLSIYGGAMINTMKTLLIGLVLITLTGGFSYPLGKTIPEAGVESQSEDASLRTVTVSGQGEVQARPDLAIVNLGVQTESGSAQSATEENNVKVQALLEVLDDGNIPAENIRTRSFQLFPRYDYGNNKDTQTLIGYSVTNVIQVEITNLDELGMLLDQVVNAGANNIQGIRFEISDKQDLADRARQAAVENARKKAEHLAELTGAVLGPVMNIQESSNLPEPIIREENLAAQAAEVPIVPGSYRVQISVSISWLLIDPSTDTRVSPAVSITPESGNQGTHVQVNAEGFPPYTEVEIGIGHWGSEYDVINSLQTNERGELTTEVTIPDYADQGEEWVVVVAEKSSSPNRIKITSNRFKVTS